jgi:membrane protein implicated in regulation of membrane protease activity
MNGEAALGFTDLWLWLIFIGIGLFLVLLELLLGVVTGLDLVFVGSAFILGGLITWPFSSWVITLIVTSIICIAYVALGRRYIHKRIAVGKTVSNIDAIIGKSGIVLKSITRNIDGRVKVGNEQWRARAEEDIKEGDEIVVTGVRGVTLIVDKKINGGN